MEVLGRGYRNVAYRVDKKTHIGEIILYGYDEKNRPKTFRFDHYSHVKYKVLHETKEKSIYGDNVATKQFKNIYDRNKWIKSLDGGITIIESLRPEQEFLNGRFRKFVDDDDFNKQSMRYHYIDIEVAVENEFPEAREAKYPINLITVYDTNYKRYYTWAMPHGVSRIENTLSEKHDLLLFQFDNEESLLLSFIDWFKDNYPDVLLGWNIRYFDVPYIMNRILNVLGENQARLMSPIGDYYQTDSRDNPKDVFFTLKGISQMDMLLLYRDKFDFKVDGGYKLDNVCETELNERKIQYSGTIKDFYKRDFQTFFEYNVRDVELLHKLENKRKLVALSRQITTAGLCQMEAIYTSISYIIGSLSIHCKNNGSAVFPSYTNTINGGGSDQFEGAYVFPTKMGLYNEGVIGIDLASLYPNTMISINCSPETKIGQLYKNDESTYTLYRKNGDRRLITVNQLNTLLDKKCILSKNNTLFYKHEIKEGIIPQWLVKAYNQRVKYRKLSKKYDSMSEKESDPDKKLEYKLLSERYDHLQYTYKIFLNSVYGILGTPFSPIYDADLAQSVTLTGQFINRGVNNIIEEKFGSDTTIAGDTDSQYIDISEYTMEYGDRIGKKSIREFNRTNVAGMPREIDEFVQKDINTYAKDLIESECHTTRGGHIRYEREVLASEAIFFKKKHYLMHLIDVDGKKVDKFKYMGIAVKKGHLPVTIKTFLKDIYENTCKNAWGYDDYKNYLADVYKKFVGMDFEDISIWINYNTEKESTGFLETEKGSGAQVRGLHYHNQFLKEFGITNKYNEIRIGDTVRYCYINPTNGYGIDVISFIDGSFPDEFREIFTIDYITMFNKLIGKPLAGYVEAMGFDEFKPSNQMRIDIFNL